MRDYVIFTDCNADLTDKMIKELDVKLLYLKFSMEDAEYSDAPNATHMDPATFYQKLRDGVVSTTAQVNTHDTVEAFEPYLEEGKDILCISFSSGLSGSYQSVCMAREELLQKYPESKITVIDSLCASLGQGLIVNSAVKIKREGKDMDFVSNWVEDNKLKVCHAFTVDDLNFLKRGGRVSTTAAVLGTMLNIKPVLHVDNEGHLIPLSKVRGRKQSLDALVKSMDEKSVDAKNQTVFISHGGCLEDAEYVKKQVKAKFGTKEIQIGYISPTVGAHSGPGTVALFFYGLNR